MTERGATRIGRYEIYGPIAAGGMGQVHYGRVAGAAGFQRTVAIKRLHPHLATDKRFVAMFVNEAHLAARVRHPNVVQTLDVVVSGSDVLLVMEYVQGLPLSLILALLGERRLRMPLPVAAAIFSNVLAGLHAAHEATDEAGRVLEIVHRDVSPQNVIVDVDGVARVIDFGIAKAVSVAQTSGETLKGKLAYMAPEQVRPGARVSRRTDVYAVGAVLWEAIAGRRLFEVDEQGQLVFLIASGAVRSPRAVDPSLPEALANVVLRALHRDAAGRFASALEMATALQTVGRVATPLEVAAWLRSLGADAIIRAREALLRAPLVAHENAVTATIRPGEELGPATTPLPPPVWVTPEPRSRPRWRRGAAALGLVGLAAATSVVGAALPSRAAPTLAVVGPDAIPRAPRAQMQMPAPEVATSTPPSLARVTAVRPGGSPLRPPIRPPAAPPHRTAAGSNTGGHLDPHGMFETYE